MSRKFLLSAGAVAASLGLVLSAAPAANAAYPAATSSHLVACPDGSSSVCRESKYSASVPNSTGTFGVALTIQYSSSGGSWRAVRWAGCNSTSKTVNWYSFGIVSPYGDWGSLRQASMSLAPGGCWTYQESDFNKEQRGVYYPKNAGWGSTFAGSDFPTWELQNSSGVGTSARFAIAD